MSERIPIRKDPARLSVPASRALSLLTGGGLHHDRVHR